MKKIFTLWKFPWSVYLRCCLCLTVMLLCVDISVAQSNKTATIKGCITTTSGVPVSFATITVEGTNRGVASDSKGNYSIQAAPNQKLVISYVGYKTQTILVGDRKVINVKLEEESSELESVVVVGYGVQKKVSVVGSVAAVSNRELTQSSAPNLSAALGGKLPGLTAVQTTGQPGNDVVDLYVRGVSTFSEGGAAPLILIDGVPRDNISSLDPSEIESISILKDASATAVFGVRGANGVILVTTRRGVAGTMKIDVSAKFSMSRPIYHIDRVHSSEFAQLRNEALANDGMSPEFSASDIELFKQGTSPFYPDRDVKKEVFKSFAPQTQANVNMSGGTENAQYFVSMGYLNQGSIYKQDQGVVRGYDPSFKFNRYNVRLNVDYKLAKNLKASLNLGADISEANTPLAGGVAEDTFASTSSRIMDVIRKTRPVDPGPVSVAGFKDQNGNDVIPGAPVLDASNLTVWGNLNNGGYANRTRSNFNSSLSLDWSLDSFVKGLSMKGMVAFDINGESYLKGRSIYSYYYKVPDRTQGYYTYQPTTESYSGLVELTRYYRSARRINLQYSINYNRTFAEKHDVTAMILAQRDNWIIPASSLEAISLTGERALPYNVLGVVGRVTYAYDNRYLAEFNAGYNGSEQFSPNKRFGFFPAVSAGWIVSNERFMKEKTPFTMLKLRASYGIVGNDKQGDSRFLYMDNINLSNGGVFPSLGGGSGLDVVLIGQKNLTWETEKKLNVGVDMDLKYGIFAKFDYYTNKRTGILITLKDIPSFQGIPESAFPRLNEGKMKNWGYEAEVGYNKNFKNGLTLRASFNMAFNDNKVLYSNEQYMGDDYVYSYRFDGYRMSQQWGYKIDYSNGNGFINTKEELAKYTPMYENGTIGKPTLGDFVYKDINEDGVINDKDMVPIGYSTLPRYTFGANISLRYRWVDFTMQLQAMTQFSAPFFFAPSEAPNGIAGSYTDIHRQAWTQERYEDGVPIMYPALHTSDNNASYMNNDFFVQDRSFLRVKMIEVGVTLPQSWTKPVGMQNVRFSVSGQNLFRFDNMRFNAIDPEQTSYYAYPLSKMITFNLNLNF